jgi:small subunit ribosomal protein S20
MPILKSPAKRMRSDAKKRGKNIEATSRLKSLYKKLLVLAQAKSKDLEAQARELVSLYDKAVSRGVIPKNRANRKKSRISALISKSSKK